MSEELLRRNRHLVEETLGPYIQKNDASISGPGSPEELSQEVHQVSAAQLASVLANSHFKDSLRVGTQIIFSRVPHLHDFSSIEEDWKRFVERVQENFSRFSNDEEVNSDVATMQEALGISSHLLEIFYRLGVEAYQDRNLTEALGVMGLISLLNPFLFEPWLVQSIIHTRNKSHIQALFTLTLSIITKYDHPAAHLCLAQVYLDMGLDQDADRSMEVAEFYLPSLGELQWQEYAKSLRAQFRSN